MASESGDVRSFLRGVEDRINNAAEEYGLDAKERTRLRVILGENTHFVQLFAACKSKEEFLETVRLLLPNTEGEEVSLKSQVDELLVEKERRKRKEFELEQMVADLQSESKRRRVSITNRSTEGGKLLEASKEIGFDLVEGKLASKVPDATMIAIADELKAPYERLQEHVKERAKEKKLPLESAVQEFSVELYRIMQKHLDSGDLRAHDASKSGLEGHQAKVDLVMCDRFPGLPYVVFPQENKPLLKATSEHKVATYQFEERRRQILLQQPGRTCQPGVLMGADAVELLWNQDERLERSGPLALEPEATSPALQALARLLCTPVQQLGYKPPELPTDLRVTRSWVGDVNVGDTIQVLRRIALSEIVEGSPGSRTTAEVLVGKLGSLEVVLKTSTVIDTEIKNLSIVNKAAINGTSRLVACAVGGSGDRRWLAMTPLGRPLDSSDDSNDELGPEDLLRRFFQLAGIIGELWALHLVHADISYGNCLTAEDGTALLIDWGTLRNVVTAVDREACHTITGTPVFMALSTLEGDGPSLSSELESLANVFLYVATDRHLHWKSYGHLDRAAKDAKYAGWTRYFETTAVGRMKEEPLKKFALKFRELFFPKGVYNTKVTVEEFQEACTSV